MTEPVIQEDATFLKKYLSPERVREGVVTATIGKTDFRKFMKNKGVSYEMIQQVSSANQDLMNATLLIGKDKLLDKDNADDIDTVHVKTFTDFGNYETRINSKIHNRKNPKTGESIIKNGGFDIAVKAKPLFNKELVASCLEEIEKFILK